MPTVHKKYTHTLCVREREQTELSTSLRAEHILTGALLLLPAITTLSMLNLLRG